LAFKAKDVFVKEEFFGPDRRSYFLLKKIDGFTAFGPLKGKDKIGPMLCHQLLKREKVMMLRLIRSLIQF